MDARGATRTCTALLLVAVAAAVVLLWRIGPVVATLSPGHGIHSGDALGVIALLVGARLWSRPVLRPV